MYQQNHHHHVVLVARISLTLSRHFSLSFIASGRSSRLHPISSHSCWMYVCAGRPAFARPCVGVHKSTSLMSSSLLLQQCPACLVCLTWTVFVIGGRWPYSWCLVGCCRQDLFNLQNNFTNHIYLIYVKHNLVLYSQHWLICHQTKANKWKHMQLKKMQWNIENIVVITVKHLQIDPGVILPSHLGL